MLAEVAEHAVCRPTALALVVGPVRWTWAELAQRVERARAVLLAGHGPGERAIVEASRAIELVPTLLAAEAAGVCLVPLGADWWPADRDEVVARARAGVGPTAAVLVHTSGTTGLPRAARLPFTALRASARAVVAATGLQRGDAWYSALPLHHVGGLAVVLRCALVGATMVLDDRFEPRSAAAALRSGWITHASFVARALERALDEAVALPFPSSLRWVLVGGGPSAPALMQRSRALGLPVVSTYGLTEAGSTVTLHRPDFPLDAAGSAGWPLPGVELRVADPDADGVGGIELRSPSCFEGYDDADAPLPGAAPTPGDLGTPLHDGWLATGDLGSLAPDGRLFVCDRRRDLIVTGGENVSPSRIEAVLGEHPSIDEVGVLGLPDPSWGQEVVAVVRLAPGREEATTADALSAWARSRLRPAERPRRWIVVTEALPRTESGKLRRDELRRALLDGSPDPRSR